VLVTIVYDHRLIDGAPLARALAELEAVLQGPIAEELAGLKKQAEAA
jgi:pyruvate/2-oxoglutarate dehydrogenase complex dihydrolipoamide acyltransferase (E2) component